MRWSSPIVSTMAYFEGERSFATTNGSGWDGKAGTYPSLHELGPIERMYADRASAVLGLRHRLERDGERITPGMGADDDAVTLTAHLNSNALGVLLVVDQ